MPKTLTKADIISAIQTANGYSLKQATDITETLLEITKRTLESGEDVLISGFGKFQVRDKKERRGRNPANDEDLILPPRKVVTFKCSGKLRDHLNRI
ncbi:MAG: integration host factor subunit alpha [Candidatus Zixiibacteriota bacterium]